jgi:hypothetical protein
VVAAATTTPAARSRPWRGTTSRCRPSPPRTRSCTGSPPTFPSPRCLLVGLVG